MPRRGRWRRVPLNGADHLQHDFEALQFPPDLRFQPRRQLLALCRAQLLQPRHPLRAQRLIVVDPMDRTKSFDAVGVLNALLRQPIPLAVQPPRIVFGQAWHPHHAPHLRFAAQMGHQGSQQPFGIDPIRLGLARSSVHLQAGRINHVIAHPMRFQLPMQPEPIIAGLIARYRFDRPAQRANHARTYLFDQIEQAFPVTALQRATADFVGQRAVECQHPAGLAQLDCK
jgi:hypothetical protein